MYIKNDINYTLRDDISIFEEGIFESIFIETTNKNREAIIGEIYRIPNTNEKDSIDKYEQIINKTNATKKRYHNRNRPKLWLPKNWTTQNHTGTTWYILC